MNFSLNKIEIEHNMNTKVDMVEVIRCKDCKKRNQHHECEYGYHSDNWFCADGEQRKET